MKLLTFATLYPSAARPGHGIFVETRLRHLLASGAARSVVVAPVPWFPAAREGFGRYGTMARTPRRETLHGIDVRHPRFPLVPKVGMSTAPFLLAAASARALREIRDGGHDFDVIDAHYF